MWTSVSPRHPANSEYHYHGYTPCLHGEVFATSGTAHSKIYGWAFDGFPIYGRGLHSSTFQLNLSRL